MIANTLKLSFDLGEGRDTQSPLLSPVIPEGLHIEPIDIKKESDIIINNQLSQIWAYYGLKRANCEDEGIYLNQESTYTNILIYKSIEESEIIALNRQRASIIMNSLYNLSNKISIVNSNSFEDGNPTELKKKRFNALLRKLNKPLFTTAEQGL